MLLRCHARCSTASMVCLAFSDLTHLPGPTRTWCGPRGRGYSTNQDVISTSSSGLQDCCLSPNKRPTARAAAQLLAGCGSPNCSRSLAVGPGKRSDRHAFRELNVQVAALRARPAGVLRSAGVSCVPNCGGRQHVYGKGRQGLMLMLISAAGRQTFKHAVEGKAGMVSHL